jgi:tetratricopeptide (TPR) repeat protein
MGRFAEARRFRERQLETGGDNTEARVMLYVLAAYEGNASNMERQAAALKRTSSEATLLVEQAMIVLFAGRVEESRRLARQSIELAARQGLRESTQRIRAWLAEMDAVLGYRDRARAEASALLSENPPPAAARMASAALLYAGDVAAAVKAFEATGDARIVAWAGQGALEESMFMAAAALERGRPREVLSLLEPVRQKEFREPGVLAACLLRGRAYVALGQPLDAVREFRKVVDHRNLALFDIVHHLAWLDLARASAASGDGAGARAAYGRLFELWKDADKDIPLLRQAQAEYVRLSH